MIASTQTNEFLASVKAGGKGEAELLEAACARLKAAGLRVTRPRVAILRALIAQRSPASIERVHGGIGAGKCDLVTVYRCMAAFEEIRLVRRAYFLDGTSLYEIDLGQSARYHVVCKNTGQVEEVEEGSTAELTRALKGVEEALRAKGFTEVSHVVEFIGTAPVPAPRQDGEAKTAAPTPSAGA